MDVVKTAFVTYSMWETIEYMAGLTRMFRIVMDLIIDWTLDNER